MLIPKSASASTAPLRHVRCVAGAIAVFLLFSYGTPREAWADPVITTVAPILAQKKQTITISGKGFGRFRSYAGDSPFLRIRDLTGHWNAGYLGDRPFDKVGLAVISWTDSRIVLGGFSGAYGRFRWRLKPGDRLVIEVWNPQTRAGPARYATAVAAAA